MCIVGRLCEKTGLCKAAGFKHLNYTWFSDQLEVINSNHEVVTWHHEEKGFN
jgi:hypothetical protein